MRSQFLLLFSIIILILSMIFINQIKNIKIYYPTNLAKYYAEDFLIKISINSTLANQTYYNFCESIGWICYYNGTNIIFITQTKEYILNT